MYVCIYECMSVSVYGYVYILMNILLRYSIINIKISYFNIYIFFVFLDIKGRFMLLKLF